MSHHTDPATERDDFAMEEIFSSKEAGAFDAGDRSAEETDPVAAEDAFAKELSAENEVFLTQEAYEKEPVSRPLRRSEKKEKKPFPLLLTVCGGVTLLCILILALVFFRPAADAPEKSEVAPTPVLTESPASDYPESPEYNASVDWQNFCNGYDTDGSILTSVISGGEEGPDPKYDMYLVYSKDMADALDAILERYDLRLWESIYFTYTAEELYESAGTGAFLVSGDCLGYVYDDGSFHFDSSAALDGAVSVNYSFDRLMRGSFSDTPLESGDGEDCQRWTYTTAGGIPLQLSLGGSHCVIFAALPESFVSVTFFCAAASSEIPGGLSAVALERLAENFDWSQLR